MSDSEIISWYEENPHLVLHVGTTWYYRAARGQPYHRANNFRDAVVKANNLKGTQNVSL